MIKKILLLVGGSFLAIITFVKVLFLVRIRLNSQYGSVLYDIIKSNNHYFVIDEEISERSLPNIFNCITYINKSLIYFSIEERILKTGQNSTDIISFITLFRWKRKKIIDFIKNNTKIENKISLYLLQNWEAEKIGEFNNISHIDTQYIIQEQFIDIEKDISKIIDKKLNKLGILFYGKPGNGKSFTIKYFSLKYKLPIYIVNFNSDTENNSIIRMFSHIRGPSIVLFEDFDNYFNNRKCLFQKSKFSFDVILNVLDGAYSQHNNVIYFMTANDINKIDEALKERPSRFKYVKEIKTPDRNLREKMFDYDDNIIKLTEGYNLDILLTIKEKLKYKDIHNILGDYKK